MDSLGLFLKETRQNTDISLGQIAKDTNIAKKYLEALENEEYSIFPGDTYLKGFLRSYSEYLGLNADEIVKRYERIKIAESPTPIDKLIPKPKINLRPFFVMFIMILFIGGIIYGGFLIYKKVLINKDNLQIAKKVTKKKITKNKEKEDLNSFKISFEDKEKMFNLKKGDTVDFIAQDKKYSLKVKELTPIVVIEDQLGTPTILIKSYNHKFDLNNDSKYDVSLYLNTWDSESANITMKPVGQDGQENVVEGITPLEGKNAETIVKADSMEGIEFSIDIQDPTFLRYKIDNEGEIEKYYDQRIKNMITARNRVIIWLSNAGAVTFNFNNYNKTYSPGKPGQIMVKVIQWNELESGEYELQISSLN